MSTQDQLPTEQDLEHYVVAKLSAFVARDDVVLDVCRVMEWEWDRAELFVKAIQEQHFRRIVLGQSPWFLAIALGILVSGIALMAASGLALWFAYQERRLSDAFQVLGASRAGYAFVVGVLITFGALGGVWVFLRQMLRGRSD